MSFTFNTQLFNQDVDHGNLADGETRQINVIYNFISGGETKTEDLIISLTGTATDPTAEDTFRSARWCCSRRDAKHSWNV